LIDEVTIFGLSVEEGKAIKERFGAEIESESRAWKDLIRTSGCLPPVRVALCPFSRPPSTEIERSKVEGLTTVHL
jgi:hypothetical protein